MHVDDAYPAASSWTSKPASTNTSSRQLSIAASARGRKGDRNSAALTRASSDAGSARDKDAVEKASETERNGDGCEAGWNQHHRVDDALYNRGQGFYVPTLIHSRRLGVN